MPFVAFVTVIRALKSKPADREAASSTLNFNCAINMQPAFEFAHSSSEN